MEKETGCLRFVPDAGPENGENANKTERKGAKPIHPTAGSKSETLPGRVQNDLFLGLGNFFGRGT